ncbi:MAG: hypothetical protein JW699_06485 [Chitinispirillaceae bacterium]|nr:hypothetical protein [Chitinispirillaceae bacterium]
MKNISIKAVALGCIADWAGTVAFSLVFGMIAVGVETSRGMGAEQAIGSLQQWSQTPAGLMFSMLSGLCFTGLGGYVAARISPRDTLMNSLLVGALAFLTSLPFIAGVPPSRIIISLSLPMPAAVIGGFLYTKKLEF